MWFRKYEYWNTNSFSLPPPIELLRFAFTEWKVLVLRPQLSGGEFGLAP